VMTIQVSGVSHRHNGRFAGDDPLESLDMSLLLYSTLMVNRTKTPLITGPKFTVQFWGYAGDNFTQSICNLSFPI